MKEDKQTRQRLSESAKQEFMEKGYGGASLRSICKRAGVTTGALYFFFKDKEDLFASIVSGPLEMLMAAMQGHYHEEMEYAGEEFEIEFSSNMEASREILDILYRYKDAFILILTKSQGTKFEHCVDEVISRTEVHYRHFADQMSGKYHLSRIDDYVIHWLSHMQTELFAQYLTHGLSKEEAMKQLDTQIRFILRGWESLFIQE